MPILPSVLSALVLGAAPAAAPKSYSPDALPKSLQAAHAKADAAMSKLQATLQARVAEMMASGGPTATINVCRVEAPERTGEVAKAEGLELGRTSARLRNPANAPRDWAKGWVEANAGKKAAEVKGRVFRLAGGRIGVLRPIPVGAPCLSCHGPKEKVAPEVAATLAQHYPNDAAVGFAEGDLRGFFWAELPAK